MHPKTRLHIYATVLAIGSVPLATAADMGVMHVDSTTIDDRFESKRDEVSNTTVISGETVDRAHTENIKQILDAVPGLTTELQSQDSLKIHIRGVENQRFMGEKPGVAVVIDGVPVFETTGRVNINLDDIESIKVIKGGASYLFGEDALSGAVIITTKRGAKMAGYSVSGEAGSFGYQRELARAGFAGEKAAGHIQVSHRKSDSYYFQGQYKADYLNGKLQGYLSDSSDLTFGWEFSKRNKDSHGTVTGVTQAWVDPTSINGRDYARHYDVKLGKYYLTYVHDLPNGSNLMVNLYQFTDHTQFWSAPIRFDAAGTAVTDVNAYANSNDYKQIQRGLKSEWRKSGEKLAWMAATDLRDNSYKNFTSVMQAYRASRFSPVVPAGTITADNKERERVYAGYGEVKYRLAKSLTATMNGRFDRINLKYNDYLVAAAAPVLSKGFSVWSWRGGLTYDINDDMAMYSNVSTGFRAPTVRQLFAGTISPTGNVAANPNLAPEHAINYEIGLRGKATVLGGLEWDIAAFQIDRSNYIMNVAGQYAGPATGTTDQYQNIGGMRNRGIEIGIKTNKNQFFSWDMAYTFLDAKFTQYNNFNLQTGARGAYTYTKFNNTGNRIPRVPLNKIFVATHIKPMDGLVFSTEMNAQGSYFADEINRVKIGGHAVYNALVNYDFATGANNKVKWSLFGRIDNVLDRYYYATARGYSDSNADGVYNAEDISIGVDPGRRWTAGLTATF